VAGGDGDLDTPAYGEASGGAASRCPRRHASGRPLSRRSGARIAGGAGGNAMKRLVGLWAFLVAAGLAQSAAHAESETFALIVTNNRSASLERPDLNYADDDGARYHALFRAVAPAENVVLLTRFDAASKLRYAEL